MRVSEVIRESDQQLWPINKDVPDNIYGGTFHFKTRVNQRNRTDGFAFVYRNANINDVRMNPNEIQHDDHVVVSWTMNPRNNNEIVRYVFGIHKHGEGQVVDHYIKVEDLEKVIISFWQDLANFINVSYFKDIMENRISKKVTGEDLQKMFPEAVSIMRSIIDQVEKDRQLQLAEDQQIVATSERLNVTTI